jgi:hypothetical protein
MTKLEDKISIFYKKRNEIFRKPLEKIISLMLEKCKYINGESLERHNWGDNPIKLKNIPKNINLPSFEEDLLNSLNLEDNEKSIVELLWGDIQLGKRVQACIIMWISVHILKRPVLYIFRNLRIDQKQLQDDIVGTENYNFNIQFIKNLFEEFNNEIQNYFEEINIDYWKDYKLPELKDINSNNIIDKLSNKNAINSNDIFCCLMNNSQLEKINSKFSEYICYNDELVNITTLVDESDLMSPTSSNDRINDKDKSDTTECEKLLAKIYKKVKYALHITGTAHSLLYNVTTRLSDQTDIQIKISKVHKMKRSNDYYGLFSGFINFNTSLVESWWDYQDNDNHKKKTYDIVEDYNVNIKKIITEIRDRQRIKYNSLLISEDKIRANHFCLTSKIIKDFADLFIVIYHGNCLRLYLSKDCVEEIKSLSKWDSEQSLTSKRLWDFGGVYGSYIDTENSEILPNNYCYFDIDTKKFNIKFVYKLLRILFVKYNKIKYKTVITITGKYSERGYSFTSDDYDNYSLHLTDQYFVSHASLNCTDISQRLRLQGKYNDTDLKNGKMKLTLWTTPELQDVIQNFYVKFIKEIEKFIMDCNNWEEIKDLLESIIDNGDFKFGKYMKYIDVSKKRKNLKLVKHIDTKNNGYKLIVIDNMTDDEISEWCKKMNLPNYICINEIKNDLSINEFIDKYGQSWIINTYFDLTIEELNNWFEKIGKKNHKPSFNQNGYQVCSLANENSKVWDYDELCNKLKNYGNNSTHGIHNGLKSNNNYATRSWIGYNKNGDVRYILKLATKTEKKYIPDFTTNYIKKNPFIIEDDKVKYSVIKEQYRKKNISEYKNEDGDNFIEDDCSLPNKYYWKTLDGWLYLYDKDKPEIISLDIVSPLPITNIIENQILIDNNEILLPITNITQQELLINNDVLLFSNSCCKKADKKNLRFGLKDIYKIYESWCKKEGKKPLKTHIKFKEEFEKLNYKEEKSKGVCINKKSGKRGYNIMVEEQST